MDKNRLIKSLISEIRRLKKREKIFSNEKRELAELAFKDDLTGVYSRGGLDRILIPKLFHQVSIRNPFAIFAADIDYFKSINDSYSHKDGDRVLMKFAQLMADTREGDKNILLTRHGGEEFSSIIGNLDFVINGRSQFNPIQAVKRKREFVYQNLDKLNLPYKLPANAHLSDPRFEGFQEGKAITFSGGLVTSNEVSIESFMLHSKFAIPVLNFIVDGLNDEHKSLKEYQQKGFDYPFMVDLVDHLASMTFTYDGVSLNDQYIFLLEKELSNESKLLNSYFNSHSQEKNLENLCMYSQENEELLENSNVDLMFKNYLMNSRNSNSHSAMKLFNKSLQDHVKENHNLEGKFCKKIPKLVDSMYNSVKFGEGFFTGRIPINEETFLMGKFGTKLLHDYMYDIADKRAELAKHNGRNKVYTSEVNFF